MFAVAGVMGRGTAAAGGGGCFADESVPAPFQLARGSAGVTLM